jgi:uncharacterized protein YndB with AHSA1/START domain
VAAPAERAFAVFTEGFGRWWPSTHHLGRDLDTVVIEAGLGGRWYERAVDGTELDWGTVLAWEPPHRLVLSWHLDGEWELDPDPDHASEVEVTFVETPEGTQVVLAHRHFERNRTPAALARDGVSGEGGWTELLACFAAEVPT